MACALLLAACAPAHDTASPAQTIAQETPQTAAEKPARGVVDYSCASDDQCAIKNVGNCCGEYPACVNVDSPTFPAQVKADCAKKGLMGVCGFPVLEGCQCVEGRCEGIQATAPQPPAPSIR